MTPRLRHVLALIAMQLACGVTLSSGDGGPDASFDWTDAAACAFDTPCVDGARCTQTPWCYPCMSCGQAATYSNDGFGPSPSTGRFMCDHNAWWQDPSSYVAIDCFGVGPYVDRQCTKPRQMACPGDAGDAGAEASDGAADGD